MREFVLKNNFRGEGGKGGTRRGSTPRRAFMDAGWLFLLAGAALVVAVVLIPPADDLANLRHQRDRLEARLRHERDRLEAYGAFLEALESRDPALVRRLAAAHLNLIPENADPIAMIAESSDGLDAAVEDWIAGTLPPLDRPAAPDRKPSLLRRLATGPHRLWVMLAGVVSIFIGLLPRAERRVRSLDDKATTAGVDSAQEERADAEAESFVDEWDEVTGAFDEDGEYESPRAKSSWSRVNLSVSASRHVEAGEAADDIDEVVAVDEVNGTYGDDESRIVAADDDEEDDDSDAYEHAREPAHEADDERESAELEYEYQYEDEDEYQYEEDAEAYDGEPVADDQRETDAAPGAGAGADGTLFDHLAIGSAAVAEDEADMIDGDRDGPVVWIQRPTGEGIRPGR